MLLVLAYLVAKIQAAIYSWALSAYFYPPRNKEGGGRKSLDSPITDCVKPGTHIGFFSSFNPEVEVQRADSTQVD